MMTALPSLGQTLHCDSVYIVVDQMPKFGDKDEEFMLYLSKNLKYGKCGIDSMKTLTWTINTDGQMIDIDTPGLNNQCRHDIIKQLKEFPKWKPGKLKGNSVCVKMTLRMCIKTG